jgi:hypothetical protein
LAASNQIFILYPDSLKKLEDIVRVLFAIKSKNTILLRTKCDLAPEKDEKLIQLEIERIEGFWKNGESIQELAFMRVLQNLWIYTIINLLNGK